MDDQRKNPCDRTYEVAIYQVLGGSGHCRVANFYGKDDTVYHAGEVRISETLSLKFQPLSSNEAIQNAVASLDAQEIKLRLELEEKLKDIREQRASLLALTHQPEVAS
jgi:hypothetical protein